jgi:peptidoglycan/xylan/chitin deacetylase (PgdA/CDA1 family)
MRVALRVEVSSLRGLRQGIPNLMRLFSDYQVRASFFFPMGHDCAGRSPIRTWRERRRLGLSALAYGTLVPAPPLGSEAKDLMAAARANGHEVGLFGLSPQPWLRRLAHADRTWVAQQCEALWSSYLELGGEAPAALATPGWQINPALLPELSVARYRYSSLTRGKLPYHPVLQGERSAVPEIPTTLPTVTELLNQPGVSVSNVHEYLYAESRHLLPAGHVFAASAEREGIDLLGLMENLLVMWKGQDGSVRALGDVLKEIDPATLPHHQVGWGNPDGNPDPVAMQSLQVPA